MATGKEIKSRIKSVKNTGKITKAMELISTVKMKKAQISVLSARPFALEASKILSLVADHLTTPSSTDTASDTILLVLISSNKGLCGAYNINVFKEALAVIRANPEKKFRFVTIGKRARDFVLRTGNTLVADYSDAFKDNPTVAESRRIFRNLKALFESGEYESVRILYGHYISAIRQQSVVKTLFPTSREDIMEFLAAVGVKPAQSSETAEIHEIEPDVATIVSETVPFIQTIIFHETLLEAKASEHASRMVAMKNAKDSASKKAGLLTLSYNKARQAAITKEVSEIVSGVESMKE